MIVSYIFSLLFITAWLSFPVGLSLFFYLPCALRMAFLAVLALAGSLVLPFLLYCFFLLCYFRPVKRVHPVIKVLLAFTSFGFILLLSSVLFLITVRLYLFILISFGIMPADVRPCTVLGIGRLRVARFVFFCLQFVFASWF